VIRETTTVSDRELTIRRMRARHSIESNGGLVTGPWSYRELCSHHAFADIDEHWEQCRMCWWCKPKLGTPPKLEKLPSLLKGRVLPPLSGKVDLKKLYMNAGFIIDDDRRSVLSMVRVRVVQHTYIGMPEIRRCGACVRFKEYGWREAAVFFETWMHRLMTVMSKAEPRKPKTLWRAIQNAMENKWPAPWEVS